MSSRPYGASHNCPASAAYGTVPRAVPAGQLLLKVYQPDKATLDPVLAALADAQAPSKSGALGSSEVTTIQYGVPAVTAVDAMFTVTTRQHVPQSGMRVAVAVASAAPTVPKLSS